MHLGIYIKCWNSKRRRPHNDGTDSPVHYLQMLQAQSGHDAYGSSGAKEYNI